MVLADDGRRYRDVNEAACGLLGYGQDELRRMRVDDLVPPGVRPQVPALWKEFLRVGSQAGVIELCASGGKKVSVSYSATANIVPGLHLSVFAAPGSDDRVFDHPVEAPSAAPQPLTQREREVLTRLALGASGADIARDLFLSPETVRTHTRRAREKLGARSRSQAIALALKRGEIDV
jgi:DNA-binding CsgD family transcriptional regulator